MKLKQYSSLFIVLLIITMSACKKDLGNYDYNEINKLETIADLPSEVVATYGKSISVKPVTKFSLDPSFDESKYTYEWSYIGPNGLGGTKLFILDQNRNLEQVMRVVAGSYQAYYAITDKASGVKYKVGFTLKVVNEINEGWMLMCDVNSQARVDMLSLNTTGSFDVINDLLASTGSELKLSGKPVMVYNYNTGLLIGPDKISFGIYLGTDQFTTKVEPNTFKWTPTMNLTYEMFGSTPAGFYADVIQQRGSSSAYMIGKEGAYYYERVQNIYFSSPISYIAAEQKEFKVAPFVGGDKNSSATPHAIFYDRTNRRFVKHTGSNSTCTTLPDPDAAQRKFSFSTGMDLLYMAWVPYNGGEVFSILKDPNSTKRFLARFNSASLVQSYYDEITATNFANAEFYAVSPALGYIVYSVGSKVYEYDMSLKTTKQVVDLGSKKISLIQFYDFKNTTKYKDTNNLMVAFYDPALPEGTNGSINTYVVPPVMGDLVLAKSFSGFGKVKSLTYRER
ncbi:PKD-like family lipoprotein [Pedobacter sp. GSP4]|uniref:PKD-like family lipoprotein n=1 Tax=Pedobacter sp. GSP4 TaxID=3453716 RepID=UPI003EF03239